MREIIELLCMFIAYLVVGFLVLLISVAIYETIFNSSGRKKNKKSKDHVTDTDTRRKPEDKDKPKSKGRYIDYYW